MLGFFAHALHASPQKRLSFALLASILILGALFTIPGCKIFEASSRADYYQLSEKVAPDGKYLERKESKVNYEGEWIQGDRSVNMPLGPDGHPIAINVTSKTDLGAAERVQKSQFETAALITQNSLNSFRDVFAMAAAAYTGKPYIPSGYPGTSDATATAKVAPGASAADLLQSLLSGQAPYVLAPNPNFKPAGGVPNVTAGGALPPPGTPFGSGANAPTEVHSEGAASKPANSGGNN